jgi:hypothetical protein
MPSSITQSQLLPILAAVVAFLFAALLLLYIYRLLFGRRVKAPGARNRPRRLDIVDTFDLDGDRQLVIVRRDNVEHLLLIGGPNDVLVEAAISRVEGRDARSREREAAQPGPGWPPVPPALGSVIPPPPGRPPEPAIPPAPPPAGALPPLPPDLFAPAAPKPPAPPEVPAAAGRPAAPAPSRFTPARTGFTPAPRPPRPAPPPFLSRSQKPAPGEAPPAAAAAEPPAPIVEPPHAAPEKTPEPIAAEPPPAPAKAEPAPPIAAAPGKPDGKKRQAPPPPPPAPVPVPPAPAEPEPADPLDSLEAEMARLLGRPEPKK